MSLKTISTTQNKTILLDTDNPDGQFTIAHERLHVSPGGYKQPFLRLNVLNTRVKEFKPSSCTDGCVANAEVTDMVRVQASGITLNKDKIISQLEEVVAFLKTSECASLWEGLPPASLQDFKFPVKA